MYADVFLVSLLDHIFKCFINISWPILITTSSFSYIRKCPESVKCDNCESLLLEGQSKTRTRRRKNSFPKWAMGA